MNDMRTFKKGVVDHVTRCSCDWGLTTGLINMKDIVTSMQTFSVVGVELKENRFTRGDQMNSALPRRFVDYLLHQVNYEGEFYDQGTAFFEAIESQGHLLILFNHSGKQFPRKFILSS